MKACVLGVLVLFAASCSEQPGGFGAESLPDVLLVVVDTLRADHLGSYGYERDTSPKLDALAEVSTRYTAAYSQAPWTTPSIAALFASRHPSALGIRNVQSPLADELLLLPEWLREQGYQTGAIVSHSFCASKWGFAQGFDDFDESNIRGHFAVTSPRISDAAISWLDSREDRPFFLFLHYFDPHFAYVAHEGLRFGAASAYEGPVHSGAVPQRLAEAAADLRPDDLAALERLYDSEVALTDREIGRVLDHLRALGRFDGAFVIVTADHGEEFFDHGGLDHAKTLYDELVRVPLIVKLPRTGADAEPAVVGEPVALIDVYPTIADVVGRPAPPGLRGRSLLAAGAGERAIFTETERVRRLRAVIHGGHKLIVDLESGEAKLFDLEGDPGERADLSLRDPERTASMRRLLDAWAERQAASDLETGEVELSDEERERLRALGYL